MRTARNRFVAVALLSMVSVLSGCYAIRPSNGGGQIASAPPRLVRPADIALPPGYVIEPVATGLTFPTGVTLDEAGRVYVVESGYSYGEVFTTPRLLRIEPGGGTTTIATGRNNGPWTGVTYANGSFYVAEGGQLEGGRILRISRSGAITPLAENLPGRGDHHTNGPVIGPDGMLYFMQGTATNSGVVGVDDAMFGWLKRFPTFHDIACRDIVLNGLNFTSGNPLRPGSNEQVVTGAYSPFGTLTTRGQVIRGQVPCNGAVMRIPLQGGRPQLVAWGFRNPFGIAFAPNGRLYVTENGFDDRGSRPVWGAPDVLWEVRPGLWYGWPDYAAGRSVTREEFHPPGKAQPQPLLARLPNRPPRPVAELGVHASANGFDFSRNPAFGHPGEVFIAELGDEAPTTGKVTGPVGFKVVRVNINTGEINDFAVNRGRINAPASKLGTGGLERPVAARFNGDGTALYVVDFGIMAQDEKGAHPQRGTGVIWRITRR